MSDSKPNTKYVLTIRNATVFVPPVGGMSGSMARLFEEQDIWWRAAYGPEKVTYTNLIGHRRNMQNFPDVYQVGKPKVKEARFPGYADE